MLKLVNISLEYAKGIEVYQESFKAYDTIPGAHLLKRASSIEDWVSLQETLDIKNPAKVTRPKQISRLLIDDDKPNVVLGIITYRNWNETSPLALINGNLKFSIAPVYQGTGLGVRIVWLFARVLEEYGITEAVANIENDNDRAKRLLEYFDAEAEQTIYTGADYCTAYRVYTNTVLSFNFDTM